MAIRIIRGLMRLLGDRRAAVSPMLALMLIPMVGAMGMATEASSWWFTQRAAQNAADSAALAAAINACDPSASCYTTSKSASYDQEAKAVAANFNFTNGTNNTTVTTANNVTCPSPSTNTNCYQVTITKLVPINLTSLVGFNGDTTISGAPAQTVKATAIASPLGSGRTYCLLSLAAAGGTGISTSGNPNSNPTGCYMFSNGDTNCTGASNHPIAQYVDAYGTSDPACAPSAANAKSGQPKVLDTAYRALASNIPADPCGGSYSTAKVFNSVTVLPARTDACGPVTFNGLNKVSTPANGAVIYVWNNSLTIASGATLQTLAGSGLTIVFTGTKAGATHIMAGSGTLDIAGPDATTTSVWKGVAIYQNPATTTGVDWANAGNNPSVWKITGLFYAPNAAITLKGSVLQSSGGVACFAIVDDTFVLKGTPSIYANSQAACSSAGLSPPTGTIGAARQAVVQ